MQEESPGPAEGAVGVLRAQGAGILHRHQVVLLATRHRGGTSTTLMSVRNCISFELQCTGQGVLERINKTNDYIEESGMQENGHGAGPAHRRGGG